MAGLAILAGAIALAAWAASRPLSAEQRRLAAAELVAGISLSATLTDTSLAATHAVADFGIEQGIRRVRVRILEQARVGWRVEAQRDVVLAQPPRLCLVGPYSAPDDAGLSEPCWGEPDLQALLAGQLQTDPAGRLILRGGQPISLSADLRRGRTRCDYPPGEWLLELSLDPLIGGSPAGETKVASVALTVGYQPDEALVVLQSTRYCGLGTLVFLQQGEPPVRQH